MGRVFSRRPLTGSRCVVYLPSTGETVGGRRREVMDRSPPSVDRTEQNTRRRFYHRHSSTDKRRHYWWMVTEVCKFPQKNCVWHYVMAGGELSLELLYSLLRFAKKHPCDIAWSVPNWQHAYIPGMSRWHLELFDNIHFGKITGPQIPQGDMFIRQLFHSIIVYFVRTR